MHEANRVPSLYHMLRYNAYHFHKSSPLPGAKVNPFELEKSRIDMRLVTGSSLKRSSVTTWLSLIPVLAIFGILMILQSFIRLYQTTDQGEV